MSLWIQGLEYAVSQVAFSAGVPALNISPRDLVVQTMWIYIQRAMEQLAMVLKEKS